jgi:hypothetical protein
VEIAFVDFLIDSHRFHLRRDEHGSFSVRVQIIKGENLADDFTQFLSIAAKRLSRQYLLAARFQVKRFEGKRSSLQVRDEIPLHEIRGDFPVQGYVEMMIPLSKSDFDRAIGLADRVRQPELKIQMKLLAVQAIASEQF